MDAFTDSAFKGNPAAVCLLEEDRDEEWLQAVASEFNISETCYLTRLTDAESPNPRFRLRWFTPVAEVSFSSHNYKLWTKLFGLVQELHDLSYSLWFYFCYDLIIVECSLLFMWLCIFLFLNGNHN